MSYHSKSGDTHGSIDKAPRLLDEMRRVLRVKRYGQPSTHRAIAPKNASSSNQTAHIARARRIRETNPMQHQRLALPFRPHPYLAHVPRPIE